MQALMLQERPNNAPANYASRLFLVLVFQLLATPTLE